jgi:hypothetical protein
MLPSRCPASISLALLEQACQSEQRFGHDADPFQRGQSPTRAGAGFRQDDVTGCSTASRPWSVTTYTRAVFFVFGLGTKQQHLGPGETRTCPRCHNTSQQTRIREFKQFTVFFVPVARWKRRLFEACSVCGTAVEV